MREKVWQRTCAHLSEVSVDVGAIGLALEPLEAIQNLPPPPGAWFNRGETMVLHDLSLVPTQTQPQWVCMRGSGVGITYSLSRGLRGGVSATKPSEGQLSTVTWHIQIILTRPPSMQPHSGSVGVGPTERYSCVFHSAELPRRAGLPSQLCTESEREVLCTVVMRENVHPCRRIPGS